MLVLCLCHASFHPSPTTTAKLDVSALRAESTESQERSSCQRAHAEKGRSPF